LIASAVARLAKRAAEGSEVLAPPQATKAKTSGALATSRCAFMKISRQGRIAAP
jgi:hypothetical protein